MNTKNYLLDASYKKAFASIDEREDLQHETRMVMYRFLSEVERLSDEKGYSRKALAKLIGTSASYITQLFRGNKLINVETIAKFQRVFDITFEIKATPNKVEEFYDTTFVDKVCENRLRISGFWAFHKFEPSYDETPTHIINEPAKTKSIA